MKHVKYLGYITVVMLLVAVLALSCAPKPAAPAEPVKIGTVVSITGFMAPDALEVVDGLELKLEEVGYEVAGRKIELIKDDHASDPTKAVDKARKQVEADKVDVILGPLFSPAWYAVADYLTESGTPNIGFMMNPKDILQFGGGNVFLHFGTLLGKGYYLGLYAYDELGYRTATVFQPDVLHAEQWMDGFTRAFEGRGGTIIQRQRVPPQAMDFAANLTTMEEADFVVFWQHGAQAGPFLTQYYDYGLEMPLMIPCTTPVMTAFRAMEGPVLEKVGERSLGMIGSSGYSSLIDTDINRRFVEAFVEKYEYYPSTLGASGYSSMTIFLEAVEAAGGDTSHQAIIDALHKVKVDTPAGTFSYTPEGLGIGDLYIVEVVKAGDRYAWEPVYKYSQIVLDEPE